MGSRSIDKFIQDKMASRANVKEFSANCTEVMKQIFSLVRESECIYDNKGQLLNRINEIKEKQIDSQITILKMMGETELRLEGCYTISNSVNIHVERLIEFINDHIKYKNMNIYIPWINQDVYNNIHPEHRQNTFEIPYGTTHLISFENIYKDITFTDFINNKINYFKTFTEVDAELENIIRQYCRKYHSNKGKISTYPIKLILPKTLTHIDKNIFNWIRGVDEIVCYKHQLEEINKALEFNKERIEENKETFRKVFKLNNSEEFANSVEITILD